jgi:hypothetical protein
VVEEAPGGVQGVLGDTEGSTGFDHQEGVSAVADGEDSVEESVLSVVG